MPVNRNALIRFRTIDNCLRNPYRKWTLEDLIDACSDALYEYEGIDKGVSRRTVQADIQLMRSDKLGYNAPIVVVDKKYYAYSDREYSITNIPLTDQDLNKLSEVTEILRQFKGFTHFRELSGMVQRLEDKIRTSRADQRSIIDFEKNDNLKGLEHIDFIYQAIQNKKTFEIIYQSFRARQANSFVFHPFLLKEYRNRWFVLGKRSGETNYLLLALDRIVSLTPANETLREFDEEEVHHFFRDVVGVTVNSSESIETVKLSIDRSNAPYVLTKPIHHSQKILEQKEDGSIVISLHVQLNFELEREILGFGDSIVVIAPARLRQRIKHKLENAHELYRNIPDHKSLKKYASKLESRGYFIAENLYSSKEITGMNRLLHNYYVNLPDHKKSVFAIRRLLSEIPGLEGLLMSQQLKKVLKSFPGNYFLTKAIFFDKPPDSNWYVTWHQDNTINVKKKIETDGYKGWTKKDGVIGVCPPESILHNTITVRVHLDNTTAANGALKIVSGSHKKRLNDEEIALITQNCTPVICETGQGGVHFMKPLLLHASSKATNQKSRRVIHLEFCKEELPNGLEWAERLSFSDK